MLMFYLVKFMWVIYNVSYEFDHDTTYSRTILVFSLIVHLTIILRSIFIIILKSFCFSSIRNIRNIF